MECKICLTRGGVSSVERMSSHDRSLNFFLLLNDTLLELSAMGFRLTQHEEPSRCSIGSCPHIRVPFINMSPYWWDQTPCNISTVLRWVASCRVFICVRGIKDRLGLRQCFRVFSFDLAGDASPCCAVALPLTKGIGRHSFE